MQEREDVFAAAGEGEQGEEKPDGVVVRVVGSRGGTSDGAEAQEGRGDAGGAGEEEEVGGAVLGGGGEGEGDDLAGGGRGEGGQDRVDAGADVEPLEVGGGWGYGPGVLGREGVDGAEGDAADEGRGHEDGVGVLGGEVGAG